MNIFAQSLWITLLGMGITFAVIALFWGLMWLLTALPLAAREDEPASAPVGDEKAKAAALAVTIALAEQNSQPAYFPLPETSFVSAWQLGMRTRQMTQKGQQPRR